MPHPFAADRGARAVVVCLTSATVEAELPRTAPLDDGVAAGTFLGVMRPTMRDPDDDLDLPALDGDSDEPELEGAHDDLELAEDDLGDALDDAAAGDAVDHGIDLGGGAAEGGLLVEAEDAAGLDVGVFDVSFGDEGGELLDDETAGPEPDDDIGAGDESVTADGGEEGPLAEDEELREEDLPALDADDDGDVSDDDLYDRSVFGGEKDELRWDDRAWTRLEAHADGSDEADDSGPLAVPGDDAAHRARDAAWRTLEETGRVTAAALLPGGGVVLAVATPDWGRTQLVRVLEDGTARIVAEVEPEDDAAECRVAHLRWDPAGGRLVVAGSFGACAFRPG